MAAGLAFDAEARVLYHVTGDGLLYRVETGADSARATLVANLTATGYPAGALGDGLGWVPPRAALDAPAPTFDGGLSLSPPAPNPAREGVWFEIRLPRAAATRVEILDVGGRRWRTWNLPGLAAGISRFQWSLRSDDGRRAPAGRYLLRVTAGDESRTASFSIVR